MENEISDRYNALPFEVRRVAGLLITETQIRELQHARDILTRGYRNSVAVIDEKIRSLTERNAEALATQRAGDSGREGGWRRR